MWPAWSNSANLGWGRLDQIRINFSQDGLGRTYPNFGQLQHGKILLHTTNFWLGITWPSRTNFGSGSTRQILVEIDSIGFGQISTNVDSGIYDFIVAKSDSAKFHLGQLD